MEHEFSHVIMEILHAFFGDEAQDIFEKSHLLQYINIKTASANRGSKARSSFANLYAIYVLIEDYLIKGFHKSGSYEDYEGAIFTILFRRQRELPFGSKLQNHGLNSRLNDEFRKYNSQLQMVPIIRDVVNSRYWINENLLLVRVGEETFNIAEAIIAILDKYIETKQSSFARFISTCEALKEIEDKDPDTITNFIMELLDPNVDARIFEIVSYSILKYYYENQTVYFGFDVDSIEQNELILYKTGRTNANDGGIDFVMKPLGRFFQVTETLDVKKYFLDIDKIEHYPISFVIKSSESVETLLSRLELGARAQFPISAIVNKYMDCIEEVINVTELKNRLVKTIEIGSLYKVLDEIILQSKVEFNFEEE